MSEQIASLGRAAGLAEAQADGSIHAAIARVFRAQITDMERFDLGRTAEVPERHRAGLALAEAYIEWMGTTR